LNIDLDNRPLVTGVLLVASLATLHTLFWLLPGLFEPLKAQLTDRLFELRGRLEATRPAYDDVVVHVDVDDRSLQEVENFYLGRTEHAQLVSNLGRAGVSAQLHDVIFAAPQAEEPDTELVEATATAGGVYYGMALGLSPRGGGVQAADLGPAAHASLERQRWRIPAAPGAPALYGATRHLLTFPRLADASRGLGFLDITADRDGVYRRAPLLARDGDAFLPSLPFRAVCDYLGVAPGDIVVDAGAITLRGARRPGGEARDIVIPVDARGRMIVNFVGPWERMTHYPFQAVYEASDDRFMMEDLREELSGKIAIVSWVATGAGDIGPVPGDPQYPLSGIHANVAHAILTSSFLREMSTPATIGLIEIPLLAILFVASLRLSTVRFVFLPPLLVAAHVAISVIAFLEGGLIVDIPGPVAVLAVSTLVVAAYQYHVESQARAVLRSTFDAYFPPAVVDKIVGSWATLGASAQRKELTILFSDIKSFTEHSARLEAGHVRELLNEYFGRMIEIVFHHQGTVDKFIGDGLMVFFGDPQPQPDHALRCVRAAIDMQHAAREISAAWAQRGDMPLEIRVGINTGHVIVGNMGSARRLSYTALGEPVNVAQRLESNARPGGILISARTYELLEGAVPARRLAPIRVKGIPEPLDVYEVPVDPETESAEDGAGAGSAGEMQA
jgi:adenylate cyclase